ncbi:MAG: leucine--tRNA ligase [Oscillospiraceae bacterium]
MKYNFKDVESKWQKYWDDNKTFRASNDYKKPKFFPLVEFPYPSGQGLHVGHPRSYTALDIISRKRRLEGENVLFCMGWDAFGLPTENFAIKNNIHPKKVTEDNIKNFKRQLKSLGLSFDWSREINTTDANYYKWTQWIFLQLFKKGLAYKAEMNVNYCPDCKVVLANEEVISGKCERCTGDVERKDKSQWMLKITDYADRLIEDIKELDYIEKVKTSQINWIGKSKGAEVLFSTNIGADIKVYTTRPDTIFGVTYMAISPEHDFITKFSDKISNIEEVKDYGKNAKKKSDFERSELVKEKTGVKLLGVSAKNPLTGEDIPIFVSDYVLMSYGTGAIMAVPSHDERDYEFAEKFGVKTKQVINGNGQEPYIGEGEIINSGFINGLSVEEAKKRIIDWLDKNKKGKEKTNYKLRDWIFARQRYWGEPIPIVICDCCGYVPVPENELPLKLPETNMFLQTEDGGSPLERIESFVKTSCPECGKAARRETDTMPQWAGSSWYYLRYADNLNENELASKDALNYWLPVDWYNGGMEHTTLHLLYSRFWHKFLYDIGVVSTKEPYKKRTSHGMILGENGEKMSKSRGNVVNPDDIISESGADSMRLYEMFIGDFEKSAPWSSSSIKGCERFLDKVYGLKDILVDGNLFSEELEVSFNKTIKKVSEDIETLKFNTAIASLMTLLNDVYNNKKINKHELKVFLILLNPFAPHLSEEIWQIEIDDKKTITEISWPKYDESKCIDSTIEIAVQVNGKVKETLLINLNEDKNSVLSKSKMLNKIKLEIENNTIIKEIYVPNKIVNIVIKQQKLLTD